MRLRRDGQGRTTTGACACVRVWFMPPISDYESLTLRVADETDQSDLHIVLWLGDARESKSKDINKSSGSFIDKKT